MKRVLFLILIICVTVYSQTPFQIRIDDFSYGLNTVQKGYSPIPYASIAQDVDFTKYPMNFTVRKGYDSVFSIPGIDSFLWNGIHSINFRDGTKKLAVVGDSLGAGYANVYVTGDNQITFGTIDSIFLDANIDYANDSLTACYFLGSPLGNLDSSNFKQHLYFEVSGETYNKTIAFDTGTTTASEIVDSFVADINASSVNPYVTAIDSGTYMVIVDDVANILISDLRLTSYPLCGFGEDETPFSKWEFLKEGSYLTSANRIHTRFPATGQLWWSQFKGITYLGTGTGKAISYDGKSVNTFPMRSPGEPNIIPLTTSGNLDGRYRYALKYATPSDSVADTAKYTQFSYLSQPVIVDSQQVMLWDFPRPTRDYYYEGEDTVSIEIWRSVGTIGALDRSDTLFYTGRTITFADSQGYSDSVIIDTASDATIRGNSSQIYVDGNFYSWQSGRPDTTIHRYFSKPGSPSIVAWAGAGADTCLGIWGYERNGGDTVKWADAAGYSYMCVYVDTNINSPSDSSRSFNFYQGVEANTKYKDELYVYYNDSTFKVVNGDTLTLGFARKTTEKMSIALPHSPGVSSILLYRGVIKPVAFDTGFINYIKDTIFGPGGDIQGYREVKIPYVSTDSFIVPYYYLIGSFTPGDTILDSLCYDSLITRDIYVRNAVPPIIKQMIPVNNQLLAHDGQYIYESYHTIDSVSFSAFSKSPINIDDGDEITTLIRQQGIVKVLKNKSSYILKQNADGFWRNFEASHYYGAVSQFSHIPAPEGDYFLSRDGFRLENENIYRANSNVGSLMSNQLNNFTNMTAAQQRLCYGTYLDNNKAVLSYPNLDTSYVLQKVALPDGSYRHAWSTWSLAMCGATQYDVRSDNFVYPGDTVYFIKSGSNGIYRYGTLTTDNGSDIQFTWKSHQLTELYDGWKQIARLYVEAESSDTVDSSYIFNWYSEEDGVVTGIRKFIPRMDSSYTNIFEMRDAVNHKSWKVAISKNPFIIGSGETVFNRFLIDYTLNGEIPVR